MTVIGYWSGFPATGEATSGYLIQENNYNLLIDCGSGVISHLQKYIKIEDLAAVILSHYHLDHCSDIGVLQYAWLIKNNLQQVNKSLPIYGHSGNMMYASLTMSPYTRGIEYKADSSLELGPFQINFLKAQHPELSYAIKISNGRKTIVYTADTAYFAGLIDFSYNCDLLLAEASLFPSFKGTAVGHMNCIEAARLAQEAEVDNLILTHLPNYGDHSLLLARAKEEFAGKIRLAESGLCWEI